VTRNRQVHSPCCHRLCLWRPRPCPSHGQGWSKEKRNRAPTSCQRPICHKRRATDRLPGVPDPQRRSGDSSRPPAGCATTNPRPTVRCRRSPFFDVLPRHVASRHIEPSLLQMVEIPNVLDLTGIAATVVIDVDAGDAMHPGAALRRRAGVEERSQAARESTSRAKNSMGTWEGWTARCGSSDSLIQSSDSAVAWGRVGPPLSGTSQRGRQSRDTRLRARAPPCAGLDGEALPFHRARQKKHLL